MFVSPYAGRLLVWARNVLHLSVQIVKRDEPGFGVLPARRDGAREAPVTTAAILARWFTVDRSVR
jgi:hypothetical protein